MHECSLSVVPCNETIFFFTDIAPNPLLYHDGSLVTYWLDDLKCDGDESSLLDCESGDLGLHNCGPYERAGVACKPIS